jgi:hypothetical protein
VANRKKSVGARPNGWTPPESTDYFGDSRFGPRGIEHGLCRDDNAGGFKVFFHDEQNVEIFRSRFRGDKTAPNEDPAQFSACGGEI